MNPTPFAVAQGDLSLRDNRRVIEHLERSELFRDYRQAFESITGLPIGLRAAGAFHSPLQASKRVNSFCALMAASNKTCAACLQLQQRVEQEAREKPATLECFAGLFETAVPIRVGENAVGYLQTGQVLMGKPSASRFRKILAQLASWHVVVNRAALETAYYGTRILARNQYESVVQLVSIFGQQLSTLSNQIMVSQAHTEAPPITKAKAFIAAHQSDTLSLAGVARAVNLSEFYFCKMFKKETGLTFIDYVARVRIETVKQLLLDPHKRVSEAAYEVGFQSLSQFNRVFRRIAGEAPSAYREKLQRNFSVRSPIARAA